MPGHRKAESSERLCALEDEIEGFRIDLDRAAAARRASVERTAIDDATKPNAPAQAFEQAFTEKWEQSKPAEQAEPEPGTAEQGEAKAEAPKGRLLNLRDYGAERLIGEPPPVKWLVSGSTPLGVAALLAAIGDTGKSNMVLQLCHHVSLEPSGNLDFNVPILGGQVVAHGTAVFITSEDSEATIHRRLAVIVPEEHRRKRPGKLIVVALPDAGRPMPLFVRERDGRVKVTDEWTMICDQLAAISDLKLVAFDPLANFAQVALDKDSGEASAVASHFGTLASQTGATVLATHHMRKEKEAPKTVAEARDRIRGSSGIVDGVRLAYALWPVDEADGKKVCKALSVPFLLNRVVRGAVVKANEQASREITTYVRNDHGLLIDRTADLRARGPSKDGLLDDLVEAVQPQQKRGYRSPGPARVACTISGNGCPKSLQGLGKKRLEEELGQELINAQRIVQSKSRGSNFAQWLDVPDGKFARGEGEFKEGADMPGRRGERGRKDVTV